LSDFLLGKQQERQEESQSKSTIKATNLGEAVRYARGAYQDYLVILPEAVAAADDCPYGDFEKVEAALKVLANFVKKKQSLYSENGAQGRPPGLKEWLREANCPSEYAAHESESTSASRDCREARTFAYECKK